MIYFDVEIWQQTYHTRFTFPLVKIKIVQKVQSLDVGNRGGVKWSDSRSILKVQPRKLTEGLNIV